MSTYLHLICLDHTPPLVAQEESGQHLYDLPQIRADLAARAEIVAAADLDIWPDDYFRRNTARFFVDHPTCRLAIRDEYGVDRSTIEEDRP
jgi:hypothetical protein